MGVVTIVGLILFTLLGSAWVVSAQFSSTIVDGGEQFSENVTITGDAKVVANPTVLAAQPGVLTTRTDGVTGTLTMTNSSHGIVTGQRIDIYWTGGQCWGATVGTVSGTSVPFATVQGGTALPIATTAVKVGIPIKTEIALDGEDVQSFFLYTTVAGYFVWTESGTDGPATYVGASRLSSWKSGDAATNPILAKTTITGIWMSHSDITGPATTMTARVCLQSD